MLMAHNLCLLTLKSMHAFNKKIARKYFNRLVLRIKHNSHKTDVCVWLNSNIYSMQMFYSSNAQSCSAFKVILPNSEDINAHIYILTYCHGHTAMDTQFRYCRYSISEQVDTYIQWVRGLQRIPIIVRTIFLLIMHENDEKYQWPHMVPQKACNLFQASMASITPNLQGAIH
jgi:hypothetical protein